MKNRHFYFFLVGWTLLNLLQAGGTGLDPDEAYYWMYSRDLDWGYFDHPPVIALMIKAGYALFESELGVRLGTVLIQTATFYFFWLLAGCPRDRDRLFLFVLLLASMPLLEVYGFIATPDGPLLFFAVLFFLFYRRFRERDSWFNTLVLGASMAALLYSKYHGILIIGFTAISSLSLWRIPRFYLASVFGALLFMPHLYWQYAHDFPSFRYHLAGRDDPYELKHTVSYLLNQLVIFNPLLFPLLLTALFRKKRAADPPERALEGAFSFVIGGFWLFFLWMTFKGHAEPQWTAVLSFPLLLLAFRHAEGRPKFSRRLRIMAATGVLLLIAARSIILFGWLEIPALNFQNGEWPEKLKKTAEGQPVLFVNSYRDPSVYAFYAGEPPYAYTTVVYRANQYDIWSRESVLHGRRVLVATPDAKQPADLNSQSGNKDFYLEAEGFTKRLIWVDELPVFFKVGVRLEEPETTYNWQEGQTVTLKVEIDNPYDHSIELERGNTPLKMTALFQYAPEKWTFASGRPASGVGTLPAGEKISTTFSFKVPSGLTGNDDFGIGFQLGPLPPSLHSPLIRVNRSR